MTEGWFLTGSVAGHVVEMTPTEAICLTFVFLVDAASLICNRHVLLTRLGCYGFCLCDTILFGFDWEETDDC